MYVSRRDEITQGLSARKDVTKIRVSGLRTKKRGLYLSIFAFFNWIFYNLLSEEYLSVYMERWEQDAGTFNPYRSLESGAMDYGM